MKHFDSPHTESMFDTPISAKAGKSSVNYNSRKFRLENADGCRTHLNIDYCSECIQTVCHQLFDEALKRCNEKQTHSDRRIPNHCEKIRSGNQEKPFHEIILQIGNKDDMSAADEYAKLARQIPDEYYQGFQTWNPNLRMFFIHLHIGEATPHLHIDFVPFTTGSKCGPESRVSLKQALAAQGVKSGTRGLPNGCSRFSPKKNSLPPELCGALPTQTCCQARSAPLLSYTNLSAKAAGALPLTPRFLTSVTVCTQGHK